MNFKQIQALIDQISQSELAEFKIKEGEFELSIRTKHFNRKSQTQTIVSGSGVPIQAAQIPVATAPAVVAPADAAPSSTEEAAVDSNLLEVRSPMVGTFYRSPAPDKPPYVTVGDHISQGSVVCIVEAMKLFNEIESEVSGKIVKVLVEDAQPVEYDTVLYLVDPEG